MLLKVTDFKTPAIRHIAWMLTAPQLVNTPLTFDPGTEVSLDILTTLDEWDNDPTRRPPALSRAVPRRLGIYFEALYEVIATDLLGWALIARNLPVRNHERTLGELDFLLRNPHTGRIEHHEIAVKFYLGYPEANGQTSWYGPNAHDRLDIKTDRLLDHQSRMTELPETRAVLQGLGIEQAISPHIYMPGYLFYPDNANVATPNYVDPHHLRGRWMYAEQALAMATDSWVELNKPHWLGPWVQHHSPDSEHTRAMLEDVEARTAPRPFAVMTPDQNGSSWIEIERIFVVPSAWP